MNDLSEELNEVSISQSKSSTKISKVEIAKSEAKQVARMRWLLVLVLVLVAAGVSSAVFLFARSSEKQDFESQYYDHAHKVTSSFRNQAEARLTAIEAFTVSISSGARARGESWPNVTVPDYDRQAAYVIDLSAVMSLTLFPLVTPETRPGWEAYSATQEEAFLQNLAHQEQRLPADFDEERDTIAHEFLTKITGGPIPEGQLYRYEIYNLTQDGVAPAQEEGPVFFPWWQNAPQSRTFGGVNYNTMSHPTRNPSLQAIMKTMKPLVTEAFDYRDNEDFRIAGKRLTLEEYLLRWKRKATYEEGPVSDLYFPIFEAYEDEQYQELPHEQRKLVAVINSYVYWQVYFEDILPDADSAQGVLAILENTCGQQFTYVINGATASYVGQGDLHEPSFDDYMVSTGYGAFLGNPSAGSEESECIYNVRVYPSQELMDSFMTKTPMIFTIVVACTFVCTSLIFVLYDHLVEKRQKKVMKKAVQSTEVVNTLFPETVRDRLFEEEKKVKSADQFMARPEAALIDNQKEIVADLYQNCTVLFADLAGFTKWSSTREPKHVFELLETIYGQFDEVAKRRRVFKIETIGDCYLAITGVPRPQSKHAVIMARFASDAMERMNEVIHSKLVHTLGKDTANLRMRVGLHSGPVTAGVLRGERARFQLFGDTVNTASRIESNGLPGKIQASKATADLIQAAGHGAWLTPREGGIEAKGKGIMETFWVTPTKAAGSIVSTDTGMSTDSNSLTPNEPGTTTPNSHLLATRTQELDYDKHFEC